MRTIFNRGKQIYKFFPQKHEIIMNEKDEVIDQATKPWINQGVKFSAIFSLEFPRWVWFMFVGLMVAFIVLW